VTRHGVSWPSVHTAVESTVEVTRDVPHIFGTAVPGSNTTGVNSYLGGSSTAQQLNYQQRLNQNFNAVVPENVGNLNWGDDDWQTLYIPASTSVYRVRMKVAGNKLGYML